MSRVISERDLHLLPRDALVKTNDLDQADWNFRPILGWVQRLRLRCVASVLASAPRALPPETSRLLEVGYGSGVFMPELARNADDLFGADVHRNGAAVSATLALHGAPARLVQASAGALPYRDGAFDTVVTVSTLEFVPDVAAAVGELVRVTKPGGRLVIVTPGQSALLDLGLRLLSGERAEDTFQGRRSLVVPAVEGSARILEVRTLPVGIGKRLLPLYRVLVATPL
ncbi:MAG TPA: class I SAM-dependent methyltransferase [Acidimicrobiia bacterium]